MQDCALYGQHIGEQYFTDDSKKNLMMIDEYEGIMLMTLKEAIKTMTAEITSILAGSKPTIYLYGSVVLDDFKLGWSDIDILVLTKVEISEQQADTLVELRQDMLERYAGNSYFRLFEGGMRSVYAFLNNASERTVYWGTSGQYITDNYHIDSFGMAQLLDSGILLYGDDVRGQMTYPTYAQMRDDISRHVQAARKYGVVLGWLLDIARGIYTLSTGKIISKTAAGEWALENGLCPDADAMQKAVQNRKEPYSHTKKKKNIDNVIIQQFADIIEEEFSNTVQHFAESELQRLGSQYNTLSLIRDKDGVSVWRVKADNDSYILKCFDKPEYRREITNYKILSSCCVPTLKLIAHTDCSLLLEDIKTSSYRLGTMEDINNPIIAKKIALWYKTLHTKGRKILNTHGFADECDSLTMENLRMIKEKTGTGGMNVWQIIEENFEQIRSVTMSLPRTLVYTDFHYSNLAVARDGSSALIFDYNFLHKSYVYSDIRNVCGNFYNEEAKLAFLSEYGGFDGCEVIVDDVVSVLVALYITCQRRVFPNWANDLLDRVNDGRLLAAVEELIGWRDQ